MPVFQWSALRLELWRGKARTLPARYPMQTVQKMAFHASASRKAVVVSTCCRKVVTKTPEGRDRHKTGINIAASLHFVAALPNTHYFEYCVEQGALRQTLTRQRFPVVDGEIKVPEEPGLGIDLDEGVVARYRVG